jgi:hypothetical protein
MLTNATQSYHPVEPHLSYRLLEYLSGEYLASSKSYVPVRLDESRDMQMPNTYTALAYYTHIDVLATSLSNGSLSALSKSGRGSTFMRRVKRGELRGNKFSSTAAEKCWDEQVNQSPG